MPSLQLFSQTVYPPGVKRELAERLGETYAAIMETELRLITVVIPDLGVESVWRCGDDGPEPAALLMCDIRRGRPAQTRERLARQLIVDCQAVAGVDPDRLKVEFTQHSGDEMFHPHLGGFNSEWEPGAT